ncbi:unnamed protein product, partial [Polarella glacialis]
ANSQPAAAAYEKHWSKWHADHPAGSEWHVTYSDVRAILAPYIQRALEGNRGQGARIVDVGCGSSNWGMELLAENSQAELTLLDVSESLVAELQQRLAADPRVQCVVGDCRQLRELGEKGLAAIVLDKGTLDALHELDDKVQMLQGVAALLQRPAGLLISISFASASR